VESYQTESDPAPIEVCTFVCAVHREELEPQAAEDGHVLNPAYPLTVANAHRRPAAENSLLWNGYPVEVGAVLEFASVTAPGGVAWADWNTSRALPTMMTAMSKVERRATVRLLGLDISSTRGPSPTP